MYFLLSAVECDQQCKRVHDRLFHFCDSDFGECIGVVTVTLKTNPANEIFYERNILSDLVLFILKRIIKLKWYFVLYVVSVQDEDCGQDVR